ncbi:hypothetical protein [Streptomyces sp. SID8352]|uniref:hypothetical protein n=1 Tax=Streptomyces sp. SID8352 TaxID=2690338 RepID=UPI0013680E20|nr:hypothetical protein [Streptomyces sp. SID8352]MYU22924.1 hypothetical protein [Streptomyces sp. SID8352]
MLLIVCLAGLAPGIATAWLLRTRGWAVATTAGLTVTLAAPALLLISMTALPPLGWIVAVYAAVTAARSFDDGRIWTGCAWATLLTIALGCAGVL